MMLTRSPARSGSDLEKRRQLTRRRYHRRHRLIGDRIAAAEAGFELGRARLAPRSSEREHWNDKGLGPIFREAYARGLAVAAKLRQETLPL